MFKQITDTKNNLLIVIKALRNEMILTGMKEGLTSEKTLAISQKLDKYISRYQSIQSNI
ncbi:aspartyl-phosphate phosphatase Spo0E family protein [Neobacillus massiliamazoniensis]|uniref:Spo0E like sporulation regulatory protein n=1 Tax=Neobacillus massiliamazoniensis TaxID=1499688 RepID=A0A0U1P377_9BACI|nr:aspartyl-phosphate phosphatase Spo0E family protein [Neobacillus massiliamazoniensis]CRK84687.1 Spo0E like sporulation regulatory protein [Neobacillus massiliamazoniensis]